MGTRLGIVVALALALLAGAGCGGDGDDGDGGGLERTALSRQADAICAKANADTAKLRTPTSFAEPRQAERYFAAAVPLAERQQRELEALEPTGELREDWDAFVAEERKGVVLLRELRDLAKAGDVDRLVPRLGRIQPLDEAISERADALGALQCGSAGG